MTLEYLVYQLPSALCSLDLLARLTVETANGLAFLHGMNVMYRNLRPASVYLDATMCVKLGDLEVAKLTYGVEENTPETGAYRYMAPEVVLHRPYSTKCDVYSFGMTWYELLHRRPPFFEVDAAHAAFLAVYTGTRPDISLPPDLAFFEELLPICWSVDPDLRPTPTQITEMVVAGLVRSSPAATPATAEPAHSLTATSSNQLSGDTVAASAPAPPSVAPAEFPLAEWGHKLSLTLPHLAHPDDTSPAPDEPLCRMIPQHVSPTTAATATDASVASDAAMDPAHSSPPSDLNFHTPSDPFHTAAFHPSANDPFSVGW